MALLETAKQISSNASIVEQQTRERIREIVRAYRHCWDIYSETLQNSVDAINRRYRILNDPDFYLYHQMRQEYPDLTSDPGYKGRILITITIPDKTIAIRDNGVGIKADNIERFLLPEGSDKEIGKEYGFKGYGLTYVAFISADFHITSRPFLPTDSVTSELQLTNLFYWLVDDENRVPFPSGPIPDTRQSSYDLGDWSTIVTFKLADDYARLFPAISSVDEALQLVGSEERCPGFQYVLRTRTAIGNTRPLFSKAPIVPIEIQLEVQYTSSDPCKSYPIPYRYYHPKDHEEVSPAGYDFDNYVDQLKSASGSRTFRSLYHTVTSQTVGVRRPIHCDFALAAISSTRLGNIEAGLKLNEIESGDVGISYGVHLAIDGMPTGLRIDDWDMKGSYLKRYFVIVDADLDISNQLDPGRKGISKAYARLISDKALQLLREARVEGSDTFQNFAASNLDHGRGREEGGLPPQDFAIKVNQSRARGEEQRVAYGDLQTKLEAVSSLSHLPSEEQEVIALFYELRAQEKIKGYRTLYLAGSTAVYDAALDYSIDCSEDNIYPNDPVGIGRILVQDLSRRGESRYDHRKFHQGVTAYPELCVDFKYSIGDFLKEVIQRPGHTSKDPDLVDLLIVWTASVPPSIPATSFSIGPVIDNRRQFHSTTHRLGLSETYRTEIFCIVLEEVLKRLPT